MKHNGDQNYNAGKYLLAKIAYDEAIKLYPDNVAYYRCRSNSLYAMGKFGDALNDGWQAVALANKIGCGVFLGIAYECVIECCLTLGYIESSEEVIQKISQISQINPMSSQYILKRYERHLKQLQSSFKMASVNIEQKEFKIART